MKFDASEWDGVNRIEVVGGPTKSLPPTARISGKKMRNAYKLTALVDAVMDGRARLGRIEPNETREIIFRGQPTGQYVSLEFANRIRGRKDEAPVEDVFEGAKSLGSAHPDGQSIPPMVHGVDMSK